MGCYSFSFSAQMDRELSIVQRVWLCLVPVVRSWVRDSVLSKMSRKRSLVYSNSCLDGNPRAGINGRKPSAVSQSAAYQHSPSNAKSGREVVQKVL